MTVERSNAVTLKGTPFTLVGLTTCGDSAQDFVTVGSDLKPVTLADTKGSVRVFSAVPSLDTPVCDAQTRRFNQEATGLPGVKIYTISMDLPSARVGGVQRPESRSDDALRSPGCSFGSSYGTLIKELRLSSRALFVVDSEGTLRHVEYVGEVADHPDYDAALEAVRALA